MAVVLKTAVPPALIADAARREVHALDPLLPVANVRTLDEVVSRSISQPRFSPHASLRIRCGCAGACSRRNLRSPVVCGGSTYARDRHPHGAWGVGGHGGQPDRQACVSACDNRCVPRYCFRLVPVEFADERAVVRYQPSGYRDLQRGCRDLDGSGARRRVRARPPRNTRRPHRGAEDGVKKVLI